MVFRRLAFVALAAFMALLGGCASQTPRAVTAPPPAPASGERHHRVLVGSGYWGEPSGGSVTLYDIAEHAGGGVQATQVSRLLAGGLLSYAIPSADGQSYYVADEEEGAVLSVGLEGDHLALRQRTPTSGHPVFLSIAEIQEKRFLLTASYAEGIVESYQAWPRARSAGFVDG